MLLFVAHHGFLYPDPDCLAPFDAAETESLALQIGRAMGSVGV